MLRQEAVHAVHRDELLGGSEPQTELLGRDPGMPLVVMLFLLKRPKWSFTHLPNMPYHSS